jgi:hypothetical protein
MIPAGIGGMSTRSALSLMDLVDEWCMLMLLQNVDKIMVVLLIFVTCY